MNTFESRSAKFGRLVIEGDKEWERSAGEKYLKIGI